MATTSQFGRLPADSATQTTSPSAAARGSRERGTF